MVSAEVCSVTYVCSIAPVSSLSMVVLASLSLMPNVASSSSVSCVTPARLAPQIVVDVSPAAMSLFQVSVFLASACAR